MLFGIGWPGGEQPHGAFGEAAAFVDLLLVAQSGQPQQGGQVREETHDMIRQAIADLRDAGYVTSQQGSGTVPAGSSSPTRSSPRSCGYRSAARPPASGAPGGARLCGSSAGAPALAIIGVAYGARGAPLDAYTLIVISGYGIGLHLVRASHEAAM